MRIKQLPAVMYALFTLVPCLVLAQSDAEISARRDSREGIDRVPADFLTVSFIVPLDEIQFHVYHIKTFTNGSKDRMLTTATRPDASGVIDTNFVPTFITTGSDISAEYFHSFLAAFNKRTNEWHYQMNLTDVSLKRFIMALAVSRNQPTGTTPINQRQSNAPSPRLYEFEQQLPEDLRIRLNGERLSFADIASLINAQTGCVVSEENGTIKIVQC